MRYLRSQSGVTLFELVLVLALSGLALVGIATAQSQQRQESAFSTAIEQNRNQLRGIQNDAYSGASDRPGVAAGRSGVQFYGKLVEFSATTPDYYTVSTLVRLDTDSQTVAASSPRLYRCDTAIERFSNGNRYQPNGGITSQAVVFVRGATRSDGLGYVINNYTLDTSGSLQASICSQTAYAGAGLSETNPNPSAAASNVLNANNFITPSTGVVQIRLTDTDGRFASIAVNTGNGTISKVFN